MNARVGSAPLQIERAPIAPAAALHGAETSAGKAIEVIETIESIESSKRPR